MAEAAYSAGELALSGPFSQSNLAVACGTRSTCISAEISRRLGVGFVARSEAHGFGEAVSTLRTPT